MPTIANIKHEYTEDGVTKEVDFVGFLGWYESSDTAQTIVTSINKNSEKNYVFKAKWSNAEYNISWDPIKYEDTGGKTEKALNPATAFTDDYFTSVGLTTTNSKKMEKYTYGREIFCQVKVK